MLILSAVFQHVAGCHMAEINSSLLPELEDGGLSTSWVYCKLSLSCCMQMWLSHRLADLSSFGVVESFVLLIGACVVRRILSVSVIVAALWLSYRLCLLSSCQFPVYRINRPSHVFSLCILFSGIGELMHPGIALFRSIWVHACLLWALIFPKYLINGHENGLVPCVWLANIVLEAPCFHLISKENNWGHKRIESR